MFNVGIRNNGILPTSAGFVHAPGLEQRMQNQNGRIGQGVASGTISADELSQLRDAQAQYAQNLTDAKASDGFVSRDERLGLHAELNTLSQSIFAFKHN